MIVILPQELLQRVHSSLEELVNDFAGPEAILNIEGLPQGSILLPNLQTVKLLNMPNLTSFCTGAVPHGSLRNLTLIEVASCTKLCCSQRH